MSEKKKDREIPRAKIQEGLNLEDLKTEGFHNVISILRNT
jgi:hypothetical protein